MKPSVEQILQSLLELSKKKVKRNASVWSSKISELCSSRSRIRCDQVPSISRCFLGNNFLHDQKVQLILRDALPHLASKRGLSVQDYSLVSYVYSCIDEDAVAEALLSNNYEEDALKSASDQDLLSFLKTIALILSRQTFGKIDTASRATSKIANGLFEFIWDRVKTLNNRYMSESVEYLAFAELMLESIFISHLIGRLDRDALNHEILDYGSLFSLIRVAHLISQSRRDEIVNKINHANYDTVLDTLRLIGYFKLPEIHFTQHLFNRLCNTPAKSTMCRKEAMCFLDRAIERVDSNLRSEVGDIEGTTRLHLHLSAIRSSRALENPHRSRIRWNYPSFIT